MMNGKEINGEVGKSAKDMKEGGVIADVMSRFMTKGHEAIYDELFLMTLNRHPTTVEIAKLEQVRRGAATVDLGAPPPKAPVNPKAPANGKPAPKTPAGGKVTVTGAYDHDIGFFQDVFWALVNSNEFMLNH
jgi:hypothetical protein